jgi:LmbE family N-acetylglucosaminyl deacetylase
MTRREAVALMASPLLMAGQATAAPLKVLLVVAHPDDEYYFAATVYRIAQELNGTVDQVIVTNGEGGYRYSSLAEKVYGVALTDESTGRSKLPRIRKKETLAAGRILGIRRHYFLNERDRKFTLDAREAIDEVWNCARVRRTLRDLIERERYDFVFTMLPRSSTHGHHQAATMLARETVRDIEPARRPVVLGAEPATASESEAFEGVPPDFVFDRRRSFGFQNSLRYDIVVHWVIAEHKSQGMFQNDVGKHDMERFWRFAADGPEDASAKTAALAQQLQNESTRKVAQK